MPILYRLSGRRYPGLCERTIRPCYGTNCGCGDAGFGAWPGRSWWWGIVEYGAYPSYPYRWDGEWYNTGCCQGRCNLPHVPLPGPIVSITEVLVDGEVLDPSAYDVEGFRRVRRLDGERWPCWQDLARPTTETDTWSIEYVYGRVPGPDGLGAARIMAAMWGRFLCGGDETCLPEPLQHIAREGVDMTFVDAQQFIEDGVARVGILPVDLWLNSVNRSSLQRRSYVLRMDQPSRNRARTWPS